MENKKIKSTIYYTEDVYKALKAIYAEEVNVRLNDVILNIIKESPKVKEKLKK